jgi:PPOX class probable F420-dependent enzyme
MQIPDSARDLLASGPLGHVVALHADGRPHVTLAWAGLDGDDLVFSTFYDQHKMRDFARDPRVSISFQAKDHGGEGLHPYVVVEGRVTVSEGGALEVMDRLSPAYIGRDRFPLRDAPVGATFRVAIERIYGVGPWRGSEAS